jgi:hypothetical protein
MPDVQFEIIRLEDIGKDVIKSSSAKKSNNRSTYKLSDADVENLKHYLNRYNQPSSKITTNKKPMQEKSSADLIKQVVNSPSHHRHHQPHGYLDITDDFYSNKVYSELREPSEPSQPLTDIYRYHHHYRRHHQHAKHDHEKPTISISTGDNKIFSLDFATCGMKKNTRLPVPNENFSLTNGSFGDDAGFTMRCNQQNFLGIFLSFNI